MQTDVVVIGSGAAGLSAALTAAVGGARVVVLEKAGVFGGTSALSGAGTWIPANHHMLAAGYGDSVEEAMAYLEATAPEGWAAEEEPLWRAFLMHAPATLRFIETHTPLRFKLVEHPDLYVEEPGGKAIGRMLTPEMLSLNIVGSWRKRIRKPVKPHIFAYDEIITGPVLQHPVLSIARLLPALLYRYATRRVAMGNALIAGLLKGCLDHGCVVMTSARALQLVTDPPQSTNGRVIGVQVDLSGEDLSIAASKGVVLATGGFEWNRAMLERHFPAEFVLNASPRTNTGDGHAIAEHVGAKLARMDQANIFPVVATCYEGQRHGLTLNLLDFPHCILVNRRGERFVSEGDRNLGLALLARDFATGSPLHLPCWRIFDAQFVSQNRFSMRLAKRGGDVHVANTLVELARKIQIEPKALVRTIERFNRFAKVGVDEDFHRGESAWERFYTRDTDHPDRNSALGAIERAPFFAAPYHVGILGTKGGPRTNATGQVLRADGSIIDGLYCAGVAMANPIGTKNVGAGTTIGPCLTWGYICARALLASRIPQTSGLSTPVL